MVDIDPAKWDAKRKAIQARDDLTPWVRDLLARGRRLDVPLTHSSQLREVAGIFHVLGDDLERVSLYSQVPESRIVLEASQILYDARKAFCNAGGDSRRCLGRGPRRATARSPCGSSGTGARSSRGRPVGDRMRRPRRRQGPPSSRQSRRRAAVAGARRHACRSPGRCPRRAPVRPEIYWGKLTAQPAANLAAGPIGVGHTRHGPCIPSLPAFGGSRRRRFRR